MVTDPVDMAGLVAREVRAGARDGVPTKIAVARRTFPTDQADLWNALTDIERIPRWFLPIGGNLRIGGHYQLEDNADGVVERCEEPDRFAVTWEIGPQISWLEIILTPDGAGTRLELVHETHVDPDLWSQYGPGAVGVGWDLALRGLGLHLSSGATTDTAEGQAFPRTPRGKAFVRQAALGWADATVDESGDPTAAHAAAEQTIALYTIEPRGNPTS